MKIYLLLTALIISPTLVFSQVAEPTEYDTISLDALHQFGYADLVRAIITRNCRIRSDYIGAPFCSKFELVSDPMLERLALPYFKRHVSLPHAREVLKFYSLPEVRQISALLLRTFTEQNFSLVSREQYETVEAFQKTPAGKAFSSFTSDQTAVQAVFRSINEYVP